MIQCRKSFTLASLENEMTSRRHASTSWQTGNKSMVVRTWQTDEYLMAMGMKQTDVSLMAVGAQCMGDNPRTRTAQFPSAEFYNDVAYGSYSEGYNCSADRC